MKHILVVECAEQIPGNANHFAAIIANDSRIIKEVHSLREGEKFEIVG